MIIDFLSDERGGPVARERKSFRIDTALLDPARQRAGLPANAPEGAVIRYALAMLAGVDPAGHVDWTPGRGSATHQERLQATA
jgi:hypothetical protein